MNNKGSGGSVYNAIVRPDFIAPQYASGSASHAALPMIQTAYQQGMESARDCGVQSNAPRTLFTVISRGSGKRNPVSIGTGSSRKAFEIVPRSDFTRFLTYSYDRDIPAAPSDKATVLSMLNGVGGNLNDFQGFYNGVPAPVKSVDPISTALTPLHLGYRGGVSNSEYGGQIGEVLFFNRQLDEKERALVESYLMRKWLKPKPVPTTADIAAMSPLIWYDPSDEDSVQTYLNTVIGIANKGSGGTDYDAIVGNGLNAPFYAKNLASHAVLPMLQIQPGHGMQSGGDCGVSGNALRTMFSVVSHDANMRNLVSIGTGSTLNAFEMAPRTEYTRFLTFNFDIDIPGSFPNMPAVLSMWNGANSDPNSIQGFFNGLQSGVRGGSTLDTTLTPLCLGHRNGGTNAEYNGQIGETLFFDRKLSTAEREAVEAYLMHKWLPAKNYDDAPSIASLTLANESQAPLTVNANLIDTRGYSTSLIKDGSGQAVIAGDYQLFGPIWLLGGTITLAPGAHRFELRLQNGDGGSGPSNQDGWGSSALGVGIDFDGRGLRTADAYQPLTDPGDGSLFTTAAGYSFADAAFEVAASATLDLGGQELGIGSISGSGGSVSNGTFGEGSVYHVKIVGDTSTCLEFNDVDLSQLTVKPADAASANPPGATYVIGRGALTVKPQLEGFPNKYRLILRAKSNELLLSSQEGALLLLR